MAKHRDCRTLSRRSTSLPLLQHALATYLIYAQGLFVVPNGQQNPILATVTKVLNAPTTTTTTTSTLSCSERLSALPPTDVLLILDSSSSADVTSWSQIVDFARQLVSALSASTGAATNLHFAVMQYARQRKVLHDWTASAGAIDAALLAAPHLNQADTRLFKALQFATDSLLVPLFNPLRRSKVPAVAILITLSDAPPALLSSNVIPLLHAQLQTMTVVGVGSGVVSAANLAQLAKPVSSVELVTKANKLSSTLLAVLTHAFCPRPPPPPTSTTRNLPGSFYTTTAQRPTTTTTTWETRPTTTTATETRPTTATTTERRERTATTTIHRETTTAGGTTTTTTTSTTAAAPSTLAPFINPSSDPNGNDDAIALAGE